MEVGLEWVFAAQREEMLEEDDLCLQEALGIALDHDKQQQHEQQVKEPLSKVLSLSENFTFYSTHRSVDTQGLSNWSQLKVFETGEKL